MALIRKLQDLTEAGVRGRRRKSAVTHRAIGIEERVLIIFIPAMVAYIINRKSNRLNYLALNFEIPFHITGNMEIVSLSIEIRDREPQEPEPSTEPASLPEANPFWKAALEAATTANALPATPGASVPVVAVKGITLGVLTKKRLARLPSNWSANNPNPPRRMVFRSIV